MMERYSYGYVDFRQAPATIKLPDPEPPGYWDWLDAGDIIGLGALLSWFVALAAGSH